MANRKVLVQDDGTGHQAYVEEGPTILLTGDETTTGHFFRGPDDPQDTPAFLAILQPGDKWTDTNLGAGLFMEMVRNAANDDWVFAGFYAEAGDNTALIELRPESSSLDIIIGPTATLRQNRTSLLLSADGSVFLGSIPLSSLTLGADGSASLGAGGFTTYLYGNIDLSSLPSSDPEVAGQAYTDGAPAAGTPTAVMVSGGPP